MVDVAAFEEYCEFGEDRVYVVLAIARSKENPESDGDEPGVLRRVVRDRDQLSRTAEELDHLVRRFDARYRLYVTANARDTLTAFFEFRRDVDRWLEMRFRGDEGVAAKFDRIDQEWTSVLQSDRCAAESNFVFDLDDATVADADALEAALSEVTTVSMRRATPNGYHLVTDPFDYTALDLDVEYELKTDGLVYVSYLGE